MSPSGADLLVHGTAVALGERAALLRGPSGAGKSDLALRCIASAPVAIRQIGRAELVADDQVCVRPTPAGLALTCPPALAGKIEVRGLGILEVPWRASAFLALVVDLVSAREVERFPLDPPSADIMGHEIPVLRLAPFEASAPLKLLLALEGALGR